MLPCCFAEQQGLKKSDLGTLQVNACVGCDQRYACQRPNGRGGLQVHGLL